MRSEAPALTGDDLMKLSLPHEIEHLPAVPPARRGVLVTAGTVGAAMLTARWLSGFAAEPPVLVTVRELREGVGGYRLSDHVLRYYETARA
jgi:hypothetical protein